MQIWDHYIKTTDFYEMMLQEWNITESIMSHKKFDNCSIKIKMAIENLYNNSTKVRGKWIIKSKKEQNLPDVQYTYRDWEYWGRDTWNYMFKMVLWSPDIYTMRERINYKAWLLSVISVLPCSSCRSHSMKFINKTKIWTISKKSLLIFLVKLKREADKNAWKEWEFDLEEWKKRNPL